MNFDNTKWDVRDWTDEMKTKFQERMFDEGYCWGRFGCNKTVSFLDAGSYFLREEVLLWMDMNASNYFLEHESTEKTYEDVFPEVRRVEEQAPTTLPTNSETQWTDKHYDLHYNLTEEDIENGHVKLDAYTVAKVWKIGSKDDSGALFHIFKTFPRYGEKNTVEREIKAMYAQIKCLAKIEGVRLD